jgi:spore coat protein A
MYNNTADTHPIHLHQVSFRVLTRGTFRSKLVNLGVSPTGMTQWAMGPVKKLAQRAVPRNEVAWKDTIQINPGEVITLRAKFDLPGQYVWHCHILSHEEHDMMRFFQVGSDPAPAPAILVDGSGAVIGSGAGATATANGAATGAFGTFSTRPIVTAVKDEQTLSVADLVLV